MKKIINLCLLILFFSVPAFSQALKAQIDSSFLPAVHPHYDSEYAFDVPVNKQAWIDLKAGLHVSFASTDQLYFRVEVPEIATEIFSWSETGWRGERMNAQILVWSADTINQIRFKTSDLKNEKGAVISRSNIRMNKINYVLSNYPYNAIAADCGSGSDNKAWLMPDKFESLEGNGRFDLPGKTVRPVWLSVDIPAATQPGTYTGTVEVLTANKNQVLHVKIKVQQQLLPKPHDWKFRLDLWQNPWAIAEYYNVKPWSEEHKALLKKHLKLYADAGGTFITTYVVHSPWADATYRLDGGMVEWIKRKNGSWQFDYSIFDQYVSLAMSVGIDRAITVYTPLPWGERFRYMDEATGNYIYERWEPASDTFKTNWNIFLTDLKLHLGKKGWFNKTYLGVNENAMEQTLIALKVIRDHSKQWKVTYAGDWHINLDTLVNDYSSVYAKEPNVQEVSQRTAHHRTSTFYVCCTPPKPNTFVFSPPVEGRWLGWYAFAHGYDGFLRWAYDTWPADPVRDARHVYWGAGDCYMVYPGGNSSIRFEKLREGIVDYEKIRILKAKAEKSTDKNVKQMINELLSFINSFNQEKEFNTEKITTDIKNGKKMIEELSEKL